MSEELRAAQAQVAAEISALAVECDVALQDAGAIRGDLARGELGVALEHLCDTLIETQAPITEQQCRRILDTAKALGMLKRAPREWSERMETLLHQVQ